MDIRKGMPGLKQAVRIANERLKIYLSQFGYAPVPCTPDLWKHATRDITLSLVIDDFRIKYFGKENADHLIQSLNKQYTISMDWTGSLLCGLHIKWYYSARTCGISMPNYLKEALHKFQHPTPPCPQNAPHSWKYPTYGAKIQYAHDTEHSTLFPPKYIHLVQQIVGTLLYYAITVDPTMLVALGTLYLLYSKATKNTYNATLWLLNYANFNPDAIIRYTTSDMIIYVHRDASYLSAPRSCRRAGGHYFLSNRSPDPTKPPRTRPRLNGTFHTVYKTMSNVMGSTSEAEICATYINVQEAVPICTLLR